MKPLFRLSSLFAVLCLGSTALAPPPPWWTDTETQIIDTNASQNNLGPGNLGQLKHVATQAKKHFDQSLASFGGAGPNVEALVNSFESNPATDYSPLNLGQLKAVAKPFYDRLLALGVNTRQILITNGYPATWPHDYPWNPTTPVVENLQPANVGQLKLVFSFSATGVNDADGDGIPDALETQLGLNPGDSADRKAWVRGQGDSVAGLLQNGSSVPSGSEIIKEALVHVYQTEDVVSGDYDLTWDDIPDDVTGNVIVEREVSEGQWAAIKTVAAQSRQTTVPGPNFNDPVFANSVINGTSPIAFNEQFNHRLRGAVFSPESVRKLRCHVRTTSITRDQPGFMEFPDAAVFNSVGGAPSTGIFLSTPRKFYTRFAWNEFKDTTSGSSTTHEDTTNVGYVYAGVGAGVGGLKQHASGLATTTIDYEHITGSTTYHTVDEETATFTLDGSVNVAGNIEIITGTGDVNWTHTDSLNQVTMSGHDDEIDWVNGIGTYDASNLPSPIWTIFPDLNSADEVNGPEMNPLGALGYKEDIAAGYDYGFASFDVTAGSGTSCTIDYTKGSPASNGEHFNVVCTLTEEHSDVQFETDTRALLMPLLASPGAQNLWFDHINNPYGWSETKHTVYPERIAGYSEWPADIRVAAHRFSAALDYLTLAHSEYWLECNDCNPESPLILPEYATQFAADNATPAGVVQIAQATTIKPGSQPGRAITAEPKAAPLPPAAGANLPNGNNSENSLGNRLSVEFEIIHTEKVRDINGNETADVVNPGKDMLLRDEIAELRIKVPPVGTADWSMQLDMETAASFSASLGTRPNVKMYDFGKVEQSGAITPLTVQSNGTTKAGPYNITLPAVNQGETRFRIVVNKDGNFKLRLKTADNRVSVVSREFTVTKRIRKYATKEHAAQQESNDFDTFFEGSKNWWTDWEIGNTAGNYTFKDNGGRYTPELLKAIAWKECDLHPANAAAHGTTQYDIMQVNAGTRPGSADMSGAGALADWNSRAQKVDVEVLVNGSYQVKQLYLFESDPPHGVQANDFSVRKMRYPASGLQTIGNYHDSVRWSLRKLLYKQYNLDDTSNDAAGQPNFRVTYRVKGAGDTLFAVKPPTVRTLSETVRLYGDITQQYPAHVFRMRDEGIATRGTGDEYRWPRLTNDKARH